MRNLISFTVTSLVVACLVLLPESGVRAEAFPVGDDGGGGGVVLGGDGEGGDDREPGVAKPTVTIAHTRTYPTSATPNRTYDIAFTWSQNVTGFTVDDISVTNAAKCHVLSGSNDVYTCQILIEADWVGSVTVTVRDGAATATDDSGDTSDERMYSFDVDNKVPALVPDGATVSRDSIVLRYDEPLSEATSHVPAARDYIVTIDRSTGNSADGQPMPFDVRVRGEGVYVLLPEADSVWAGETVTLAYTTGTLRDLAGNHASSIDPAMDVRNLRTLEKPGTVQGLSATGVDTESIELDWDPPDDDGGSPITGYSIRASKDRSQYTLLRSPTGDLAADTVTEFVHDELDSDEEWHYLVWAVNAVGDGDATGATGRTKREGDVPDPPTELRAEAESATAIRLDWDAPTNTGTSDISGYRIEVSPDGNVNTWTDRVANTGNDNTTFRDTGLQPNTTRHYRVRAINDTGESDPSDPAQATTVTVTTVPDSPTNLIATAQGQDQINLSWTAPAYDGGSAITHYRIQRSHDGIDWTVLPAVNTTGDETTYSDTGLDPATTRHYRVYAINDEGPSANPSNDDSATTEAAVPGRPTGLTATPQGTSQINLSWTAPADDGGSAVTDYLIEVSNDGRAWGTLEDDHPSTSYQHTGLNAGSKRYYRVSAINSVGAGQPSSRAVAETLDVPGPPRDLKATPVNHTQIDLSWTAPASDGQSPVTGYGILASDDAGQTWTELVGNTNSTATSFSHVGLTAGSTWHYRVWAINSIGPGPLSAVKRTTTGATVPDPPTDLEATPVGRTRIDLDWETPAFDGGSAITGYRIEMSEDEGGTWSRLVENSRSTRTRHADTGLSSGTTRHYRVYAINDVGTGEASNEHQATTAPNVPGPPRGLDAVATGMTSIDLSWSPPASDSGSAVAEYRIEVSRTGNSGWSREASTTDTDYSHTGLTPDTRYFYRVHAVNSVGPGAPSNVVRATTDPTVPDAPTNLTATAEGQSGIKLTWRPPGYDGGSLVTGYQIEFSADGGTTWEVLAVVNPNTIPPSHEDSGLAAGTTRHYRVSAINDVGTGEASNVDHATTDATVPDAPTGLDATADGPFRIDLSWTAPAYDGDSPITGYRIEFSETRGASWKTLVNNTGSTSTAYSDADVPPATRRDYRVSALNAVGASLPSNVDHATTDPDLPGAPTDLTATADGTSRIDLSWTVPDYDGGADVTGYMIEWSENGGSPWEVLEANTRSTATTHVHTGLAPATTRHYRVSAINRVGVGDPSNRDDATTDATTPDAPTDLTAAADGTSRIDLDWTAPDYDGGARVTGYRIEVSDDRGATWTDLVRDTGSPTTIYAHIGLSPASTRHYRVSAINRMGAGDPSDVADATTDASVPDAPTGLGATADGPFRIDLSWTAPNYDGGSPLTAYRIEFSETRGASWKTLVNNTGSTSTAYSHTDVPPATRRDYRVSAVNAVGASLPSNVDHATTDPDLPDAPTDLTATPDGTSRIELEWTAPDYTGGVAITGYRIEMSEDGGSPWDVLEANTRSRSTAYAHTGLAPATTRHYRVSAINVAGVGEPSNKAQATTDATTPDAPTDLTAAADGTSRIDLAWTAPDYDGGADVTGYRIEVSVDRGATWTDLEANTQSPTTTYRHTGLSPATTRHYRVSAINRVGAGDPSDVADATTDASEPDAPQRLTAAAHDHERIDLGWAAPDFDGGSPVTGYRIEVSENAGSTWADLVANTRSAETEHSHTGLDPATTRHYRVSAINEIGTGEASNVANATTDAVVPDRPTDLVATATEPTRIDLEWSAPAYDGGAPIGSYRIEVSEDGAVWTDLQRSTGTTLTSYAHIGLKPGSTRHYRVSAINIAGTGLPSNVATASTDDPVERAGRVNEAILPHFAAAATTSTMAAISGRIEAVASRNPLQSQLDAAGLLSRAGNMGLRGSAGGLNMARLFDGKSFTLPLGGDGQQEDIATPVGFTTWGSAEYTSMGEPTGEGVEWEGDMLSIHIGADARVHRDILAGIAGSRSAGNYDFTDVTDEREVEGTYEARMTSLNPYVAWLPGRKGVAAWVAGSFGWGEVTVDDEPGGQRASDTRSRAGAVGGSRIMMVRGPSALRLRAEGWMSQVEVDGSEGMDSLTLDMQRLRVALEWSQVHMLQGGREVNFLVEGGLRYGDGDGTEGAGMEIGGGLRFVSATRALTVEGHGRLLATSPNEYEEWGFRGLVQIEPQAVARGLSLKITPAWGQSASGVQELYEQGAGNRPDMGDALQRGRVNTRVEYGLGEFGGTPYGRFYLADGGARAFGTGMRYSVTRVLDLRFEGTRTESAGGPVRHGLAMRGRWVF